VYKRQLQATLDASDPDDLLAFVFDRPTLTLERGAPVNVQLQVNARSTFYDGPPQPQSFKVRLAGDGLAPIAADATFMQEAVPRPVPRKFPLIPVIAGVFLLGLLTAAVIERDPLMQIVTGKPTAQVAPNTGNSVKGSGNSSPTPTPTPTPSPTPAPELVTIPNVSCMTASVAQQTLEAAGFKFSGSFVSNPAYPKDVVFKTQPLPGQAPKGTEVTAFISTGPSPGNIATGCLSIIRVPLGPADILKLYQATPTPIQS